MKRPLLTLSLFVALALSNQGCLNRPDPVLPLPVGPKCETVRDTVDVLVIRRRPDVVLGELVYDIRDSLGTIPNVPLNKTVCRDTLYGLNYLSLTVTANGHIANAFQPGDTIFTVTDHFAFFGSSFQGYAHARFSPDSNQTGSFIYLAIPTDFVSGEFPSVWQP